MKQLMVTIALSAMALSLNARSLGDRKTSATARPATPAANIDIKGDNVVFSGLARTKADVYVMDAKGNVLQQASVDKKHNSIDIAALPKENHLIALKQGKLIKLFAYAVDVVVKAKK